MKFFQRSDKLFSQFFVLIFFNFEDAHTNLDFAVFDNFVVVCVDDFVVHVLTGYKRTNIQIRVTTHFPFILQIVKP